MSNFGKIHVLIYKSSTYSRLMRATVSPCCQTVGVLSVIYLLRMDGWLWQEITKQAGKWSSQGQARARCPILFSLSSWSWSPGFPGSTFSPHHPLCICAACREDFFNIKTRNYFFGVRNDFSFQYWKYEYYTAL